MSRVQNSPYDRAFYRLDAENVLASPRAIVPIVHELVRPASVLDVGCGIGGWLAVFRELGVERILGLDGAHVNPEWLKIPRNCFRRVDLSQNIDLNEHFDLAMCLEVAEHLPRAISDCLIDLLVRAAPCVLFSAAIPCQGGTNHVNEQWPEYWHARFDERGYQKLDVIRREIWTNRSVEYWYRQNTYLYMNKKLIRKNDGLLRATEYADDLVLIHRDILEAHFGLRPLLRRLPRAVRELARRRLAKLHGSS